MFFFYPASCVPGLCVLFGEWDVGVYVLGSEDRGSWHTYVLEKVATLLH